MIGMKLRQSFTRNSNAKTAFSLRIRVANCTCSCLSFPADTSQGKEGMDTKAAVAFAAGDPLKVETVQLEGPRAGEVLVEVKATGVRLG